MRCLICAVAVLTIAFSGAATENVSDEVWLQVEAPVDNRLCAAVETEEEFIRLGDIGCRFFRLDIGLFTPEQVGNLESKISHYVRKRLDWAKRRKVDIMFVVGPSAFEASQTTFNPTGSATAKWDAWDGTVRMVKQILNDAGVPDCSYFIELWSGDNDVSALDDAQKACRVLKAVDKHIQVWEGKKHPLYDRRRAISYAECRARALDRQYLMTLRDLRGEDADVGKFITETESLLVSDENWSTGKSLALRAKVRTLVGELTCDSAPLRAVVYGPHKAGNMVTGSLMRMGVKSLLLNPDSPGHRLSVGTDAVVMRDGRIVSVRTEDGTVFKADMFVDCSSEGAILRIAGVDSDANAKAGRLTGEYEMTEENCRGWRFAPHPIALAYPNKANTQVKPFPVDYGAILPKRSACRNLLSPGRLFAADAFSRIVEPESTSDAVSRAAGVAAALAIRKSVSVQDVDYNDLRKRLEQDGQSLRWLNGDYSNEDTSIVFGKVVDGSLRDDCWMWGHDTGVYDHPCNNNSLPISATNSMPDACAYLGIPNVCAIRWQPVDPDGEYVGEFASMKRVSWVLCGRLQKFDVLHRQALELLKQMPNLTGLDLDDYFTKKDPETADDGRVVAASIIGHRTLVRLRKEVDEMNGRRPSLRIVIYGDQGMGPKWKPALELVDEVLYWTWESDNLSALRASFSKYRKIAPNKRTLLGIYLWDFGGKKPIAIEKMHDQLNIAYELYRHHEIDGLIFHCTPLVNKNLAAVEYARRWLAEHGDEMRP